MDYTLYVNVVIIIKEREIARNKLTRVGCASSQELIHSFLTKTEFQKALLSNNSNNKTRTIKTFLEYLKVLLSANNICLLYTSPSPRDKF